MISAGRTALLTRIWVALRDAIGCVLAAGAKEALLKLDMVADDFRLSGMNDLKSPNPHSVSIGRHLAWDFYYQLLLWSRNSECQSLTNMIYEAEKLSNLQIFPLYEGHGKKLLAYLA